MATSTISNHVNGGGPMSPVSPTSSSLTTTSASNAMKILINLNERDIIKLIIEFLANRELNISMLDLERETGVINGAYSDDILFLRQLILDGQWDDAIEFVQPLKAIDSFDARLFQYVIMKHQYLELLCLKSEANTIDNQLSVEQLVTYLNDIRAFTPSEDEYKKLCLLLTSPRIQDHPEYRAWNPSSGRLQCFKEVFPLVSRFLTTASAGDLNKQPVVSQNERLVQLLVKGLLYESCVEYCQARATSSVETYNLNDPNILLMQMQLSETDASLLSWLHALPVDTFSCPFEEKPLKLSMDRFVKPNLEATWADAILATPIKPQQMFPYNAVPTGRSRNTELMSRSLAPQYEGLSFGLNRSQIFTSGVEMQLNPQFPYNSSAGGASSSSNRRPAASQRDLNELTRSIALFNYTDHSSSSSSGSSNGNSNGVNSSNYITNGVNGGGVSNPVPNNSLPTMSINGGGGGAVPGGGRHHLHHHMPTVLNGIKEEETPVATNSPPLSNVSASSSGSSLNKKIAPLPSQKSPQLNASHSQAGQLEEAGRSRVSNGEGSHNPMVDSTLFKEYQKNKAQIIHQLEEQEKRREDFVKQLKTPNVQNALNAVSKSTAIKNSQKSQPQADSPSPVLDSRQNHDDSFKSPKSPSTSVLNGSDKSSPSPPLEKEPARPSAGAATRQSGSSSNLAAAATTPTSNSTAPNNKPIVDTTKFDSLEDITKAASFVAVSVIEDQQAIRAVDIHPSGNYYVVGSNSKCLRVCPYPNLTSIRGDHVVKPASVLYKRSKHHYGSIYCVAWNASGNLIATGSNDKTIKLVRFNPDLTEENDSEVEITCHNGTIRDLIFMHQEDNNILVSGGAGDCKINVLDCQTQQSLRSYSGHNGHVFTLYTWPGTKNVFVSGSQDKTCRFWDLRAPEAIQTITPSTTLAMQGSPVAAVAVDPSGLLLSSGHEDAACCLYDIRGSRIVQIYKPHTSDIRSVRFSANAYYLLTASYDNKVIITDLHGDLTKPLNWSIVAGHNDKVIQARWHPNQMSFVTTSADRSSVVWSLPSAALANASMI